MDAVGLSDLMSGEDFSVVQCFGMMREMNAGVLKLIASGEDERPNCMVILVDGVSNCEPVLAALEKLQAEWDAEEVVDAEESG